MKWNYWSYQCKIAKLAQTKAICLYSPGKSESSLIILWLELILGPCLSLSPWEPGTMYYRALRILNTYSNPWCRLLIDLHVRLGTEAQNNAAVQAECGFKKQVKVGFQCLSVTVSALFDFYYILFKNSRKKVRSGETIDLHICIRLHKQTLETAGYTLICSVNVL